MAYFKITTNKKGEMKAKIQVSGKDANGNAKLFYKLVTNDDNFSEPKFRKQVKRIAEDFEDEIINAIKEEKVEIVSKKVLTFNELAEEWLMNIKAMLSKNYYVRACDAVKRFNAYLERNNLDKSPISAITVRDVQLFFNEFMFNGYDLRPTVKIKRELPKIVNFRGLERKKIINRCSSYNMNHRGENISIETAKQICKLYDIDFKFYFELNDTHRQYAPETIKGYRRILRTLFNEAIRYEWIEKNPVCGTKITSGNNNTSLGAVHEKEVFTFTEAQEFLSLLDTISDEYMNKKIPLKFMLLTGVRIAELCGLRWSDIDLENKIVHIKRSRNYLPEFGVYEKEPKTRTSIRDIPLPDGLIKDLEAYKEWFRLADNNFDNKLDEYYFNVNVYRQPVYPSITERHLSKFEKSHGLKEVSCHGLRHTYCSLLLSQNVPIQTVSKYMGHSDSSITLKVYSHFIPDTQEKVVFALNNIISKKGED